MNFLVPFVFTLSPEELGVLLQAPIGDVLRTSITAALGVAALAAGLGGWMRRALTHAERVGTSAAGLLLFYPGTWADMAGLAIFGATAAAHLVRTRDWQ